MNKIKVLIADDHPAFREGLSRLLNAEEDLEVIAKAADGEETVSLAKELVPDVAIIDVAMPKLNGIEAAKQIREACPTTAILMVSAYGYESYVLASLQARAAGYLLKNTPVRELISAIRSAHAGQAVFDFKVIDKVMRRVATEKVERGWRPDGLRQRELQVLKLVAKGMANKQIARELVISERTVQTHLVRIFRKLGVSSRTEAVLHALKEGWFSLDDLP